MAAYDGEFYSYGLSPGDAQLQEDLNILTRWNEGYYQGHRTPSFACHPKCSAVSPSQWSWDWWVRGTIRIFNGRSLLSFLSYVITVPGRLFSGGTLAFSATIDGESRPSSWRVPAS